MEQKSYDFVSYHVHREKYSSENIKSATDKSVQRFDRLDYNNIISKIRSFDHESDNWDHFGDVLDFDTGNQYLCAVNIIMREQNDEGFVKLQNWDLMTEKMKMLLLLSRIENT